MLRLSRTSIVALAWALMATHPGCSSDGAGVPDEELGGLVVAEKHRELSIDTERLRRDSHELVRAARMSHAQVAALVGNHRYRGQVKVEVKEGAEVVDALEIETTIEFADGNYHALSKNSRDYGREVVFADGSLYLAPRYSRFHKRAPETASEPQTIRNEMFSELGAHLELIARGIDVEDRGTDESQAVGQPRTVRTVGILKAAAEKPVGQPEHLSQRVWRNTITVTDASGKLAIDAETGVVLHGEVHGALTFTREGRTFAMTFDIAHDITDIGADIAVAAPPDDRWVATPLRRKEVEERDRLLEGIAPPTRKFEPEPAAQASGAQQGGGAK